MTPRLQSPWFTRLGLPLARALAWILFTLLGPTRVRHRRLVPRQGGLLILANHLADVDPIVVQLACPREVYFMGKSELFEMRGLRRVLNWFRAFPVKRGEPDRDAIKTAVALLQAGKAVCVFPEGQLSETGELQELKAGVALIARMADCPIICCRLENTNRVMPYGSLIPRPALRWVTATWSESQRFERSTPAETTLAWAGERLARPKKPA